MTRAGDREKTRAALLEAAREEIASAGIRGASVEAISRRAGVTKGAFYYAFASKPALLTELGREASVTLLGHGADLWDLDPDEAAAALLDSVRTSRQALLFQVELWLYATRDDDMREQLNQALVGFSPPLEVHGAPGAALGTRSLLLGLVLQLLLDEDVSADVLADVLRRHVQSFPRVPARTVAR